MIKTKSKNKSRRKKGLEKIENEKVALMLDFIQKRLRVKIEKIQKYIKRKLFQIVRPIGRIVKNMI
jgi:hypothetical protein